MFYLADLVGYVQVCTEIQKNTQSSNTFLDAHLQVAQEQKTIFRVMMKTHEFSKRQLFLDAMHGCKKTVSLLHRSSWAQDLNF